MQDFSENFITDYYFLDTSFDNDHLPPLVINTTFNQNCFIISEDNGATES